MTPRAAHSSKHGNPFGRVIWITEPPEVGWPAPDCGRAESACLSSGGIRPGVATGVHSYPAAGEAVREPARSSSNSGSGMLRIVDLKLSQWTRGTGRIKASGSSPRDV